MKQIEVTFVLNIQEGLTPDEIDAAIEECPFMLKKKTPFTISTESWGGVVGEDEVPRPTKEEKFQEMLFDEDEAGGY